MKKSGLAVLLLLVAPAFADEVPLDPFSGLKMTGDWQVVLGNCIACHSPKLITQQRGTREQWLQMIRWMQKKQNLWEFSPEVEDKILTYLSENYAPSEDRRRAAIPPNLMPPNPYAPPTREPDDAG